MARPKKYKIELTNDELKSLKSVIRKNKTSKTIRCRCQIIINLDESHGKILTNEQSAKSNSVCLATVTNTMKKYFEDGIDAVTGFKRNVNSDNNSKQIFTLIFAKANDINQFVTVKKTLSDAIMNRISYASYKSINPSKDLSIRVIYRSDSTIAK